MAQDFTTTGLLASIKRRGMLPTTSSGQALDASDYLAIATEELQGYVFATFLDANQEFGVTDSDTTVVSGTSSYVLPQRAAGEALRNLKVDDGNGNYYPLNEVPQEHAADYGATGSLYGYYFADDKVVLVPASSNARTLRFQYFRRPSSLVATSATATISSINVGRTVITTTSTIPTTFTSGVTVDVVSHTPGFRIQTMDAATTGTVSGTTITLSTALPSSVVAGNYVCLAGESCVPQVPEEGHPLLAQRTAAVAMAALGYKKADSAFGLCDRMRKELMGRLMPRSTGTVQHVVNRNGPGFGSGGRGRYRFR